MKKTLLFLMVAGIFSLAGQSLFAQIRTGTGFIQQCDRSRLSPIKCGYYDEGFQDGANDARSNLSSDYDRYDDKFESKYESFYRDGYNAGYRSIRSDIGWNDAQRDAYEKGYDYGEDDRKRRISRLPARYEGRYDRNYSAYYRKGYNDGFDNRRKQYDTVISNQIGRNVPFPNRNGNNRLRPTTTGNINWIGRVDNRANIVIQNGQIRTDTVAGRLVQGTQTVQGVLPRREGTFSVRKLDGRGTAFVLQQPNRSNNFTAIIEVFDSKSGADNYRLNISWQAANTRNVQENYQSGKVTWRGRVDATVNIKISGDFVDSMDITGSGLSNVTYDLEGYLAARPGSVTVRKRNGRGTVSIVEQPNARNDYTAVIQIFDAGSGDDEYELEISW
jgi:hypothetical protein